MPSGEHMYIFLWGICPGVELIDYNGSVVKNPPANAGDMGLILGWEDSLEKEMATYSSIVDWEIPWTGEPGGLQSTGSQKSQPRLSN